MRGASDTSSTYPFRAKAVLANPPISNGGWGVFNIAKQEFVEGPLVKTEAEAIAASFAAKKALTQ